MSISLPSILFIIELIASEYVFFHAFNKRSKFPLRVTASIAICLLAAAFFQPGDNPSNNFLASLVIFSRFFLLFVVTIGCAAFCFEAKFGTILSACTAAYALQHLVQRTFVIIGLLGDPFATLDYPWNEIIRETVCLFALVPLYLLFVLKWGRKISENYYKNDDYNDPKLIAISVATIFICLIVTRILDFEEKSLSVTLSSCIYAILCCLLVLFLKSSFIITNSQQRELALARELYAKEQEEYRSWQNSLDVINIKCHDLKYQIAGLRKNYSEENIREIEESVMIYESALKTGNEVLDVILFEKNVYCEKNGIQFVFMVDGAVLDFVEKSDLFTFFSNMLNNAIEAVVKVEEDKRVISLTVKKAANMVFINEENYFVGELEIKDNFPLTSKDDKTNHGFGLKSMRRFAEKYGGTMNFSATGERFALRITLPCN
ncbi:MAG: sensor histidine kinase [Clostridia bacterium]|nr:sensor histidine kinase [Clostridia bacterium]